MTLQPGKHLVQAGGKKNRRVQLELEVLQVSREFVVQEGCLCSEVRCPGVQVLRYKCQPVGHKRELWTLLRCCRVPPGMETRVNGQEKEPGEHRSLRKGRPGICWACTSRVALLLVNPKGSGEEVGGENIFPREYRLKIIDGYHLELMI